MRLSMRHVTLGMHCVMRLT